MASILLIDDDEALRNVTAEILMQAGYTVDDAPDGRSGLELFRTGRHDVVITDIAMPDMDGLELIMNLSRSTPKPRIIAISGDSQFSESVYLPTARQFGVQSTIGKPIRAEVLLKTVAEVIAGPGPR
jgi:two-component system response regulator (stage 0 sporulation protein F)